jgi:hypothetical protein
MKKFFSLFPTSKPTPQAPQVPQVRSLPAFTTSEKPQKAGTFTTVDPGTELTITSEKGEYRKTPDGHKFGIVLNEDLFQTVTFVKMEKIDKGEGYGNAQVGNRGRYDIFYTVELESGEELTFKENKYVFVTGKTSFLYSGGKYKRTRKSRRKVIRKVTRKPMRKSKK